MSELPLSIGILHFTGIGGIGMSGIAEILFEMGYQVQGSDSAENANVRRLREKGIKVICGQSADNVEEASILVISTAIKPDNPELVAARERFIPVVHRAEMLGELMRLRWSVAVAGTHGKTTTTSLVATLLDSAGIDPTVVNGGIITGWGSNARLGHGQWMVVEADESDGSFAKLNPTVAVVTTSTPSISTITEATRRWSRRSSISSLDPLLRLRHPVHRPSGGAAADGRHQGPARDHLRLPPMPMCARSICAMTRRR